MEQNSEGSQQNLNNHKDANTLKKLSLEELNQQVSQLTKIIKNLEIKIEKMGKTLLNLNKTVEYIAKTAEENKNFIQDHLKLLKGKRSKKSRKPAKKSTKMGFQARPEITEENFLQALRKILRKIKSENPEKSYIKISELRDQFKEQYRISDEKFNELLIENHWKHNIELLSGTGNHAIKDHFGVLYHNIKL
ncbi:MAG: hypothetical protein ACTSO9_00040 [Candidatus Helarchaeota archaeon]